MIDKEGEHLGHFGLKIVEYKFSQVKEVIPIGSVRVNKVL